MSSSKKLLESLQKKKAAESLAVQWVERLIEPAIPTSLLEEAVQFIEPRHYNDVIEERSIDKLCGWPLCRHILSDIPLPKYHVSMKQRKVVDLTERKKFCSVDCYRSSNFITSQIPSVPIWSRNSLAKVKLKFLDVSRVPSNDTNEAPESSDVFSEPPNDKLNKLLQDSVRAPSQTHIDMQQEVKIVERMQQVMLQDYSSDSDDEVPPPPRPLLPLLLQEVPSTEGICFNGLSTKEKIAKALSCWYTPETHKWLKAYFGVGEDVLVQQQSNEDKEGTAVSSEETMEDKKSKQVFLPSVHGSEVTQIQKDIFMQQLRANFTQVVPLLGLSIQNVLPDVTGLVKTFRLSNYNIVFKPVEWKLIVCVLLARLKIIDLKDNKALQKWLDMNSLTLEDFVQFTTLIPLS